MQNVSFKRKRVLPLSGSATGILKLLLILSMLTSANSAIADVIRLDYSGTATSASGIFADDFALTPTPTVLGSVFIETGFYSTVSSNGTDLQISSGDLANQPFNSVWEMTVQFGTESHTTANNQNAVGINHHTLITIDGDRDDFYYSSTVEADGDDRAALQIAQTESVVGQAFISPGVGSFSPSTVLDQAFFDSLNLVSNELQSLYRVYDDTGTLTGELHWVVEDINAVTISTDEQGGPGPTENLSIPPMNVMFSISLVVMGFFYRKRAAQDGSRMNRNYSSI